MRVALLALVLVACTRKDAAPPALDATVTVAPDAAPPPDAPVATVPRPPGTPFACGAETCHAQQYCRRVQASKGSKKWGTVACAAVPDPCRETPDCACLARYGVAGACVDEAGHAVVEVSY